MPSSYHVGSTDVNSTPVHVPPIDLALVSNTLRETLRKILSLSARYGFCYASYAYMGRELGCSPSTIRKHIARLIHMGIVRREEVPGYADRLFICPQSAWKSAPDGAQNGRTPTYETPKPLKPKNKQPARGRIDAPGADPACPAVVVVSSAKASGEEEECWGGHIGKLGPELPIWAESVAALGGSSEAEEEDAADISSLLLLSISAAEEQMGRGEDADSLASNSTEPQPVSTPESPLKAQKTPKMAAERPKQGNSSHPALASSAVVSACLTPHQQAILRQLLAAGTLERQAGIMARGDAQKAEQCLRVLAGYRRRGKAVEEPGGLLWSLWNDPEFRAPVERKQTSAASTGMARDQGQRIADRAAQPLRPVGQVDRCGQGVVAALRAKGFGTSMRD